MLNHNDDFNVATYWSRCFDRYRWGVEVTAVGENQILDNICCYFCADVIVFRQWYFWTGFPRFV